MIKKVLIFLKVISRPRQCLPYLLSPSGPIWPAEDQPIHHYSCRELILVKIYENLILIFFCFLVARLLTMFLRVLLGLHWIAGSTIRRHFNRQFHTKHLLITLCCFCSIYFSSCIFETSLRPGDGFSINSWENIGFFEHVELFFHLAEQYFSTFLIFKKEKEGLSGRYWQKMFSIKFLKIAMSRFGLHY